MSRHILVVAHGSRRESSNHEVEILARKVALLATEFDSVSAAFLEMADPDIESGLQRLIDRGACEIIVLPYFLAAGRHVVEDVPKHVNRIKVAHPDVDIRLSEHLGAVNEVPGLLLKLALSLT